MSHAAPHKAVHHDPHDDMAHQDSHNFPLAHPLPMRILVGVFALLLFFTFITVAATWVELGSMALWVALLIAVVKGTLVCLYFMHLRYDSPFYSVAFCSALLFLALFIGIALVDTGQYMPNITARVNSEQPHTPIRVP
jgi:cytochrome c oxidase subunit 4